MVHNHGDRVRPPKDGVVGPLTNGHLFMAYKMVGDY